MKNVILDPLELLTRRNSRRYFYGESPMLVLFWEWVFSWIADRVAGVGKAIRKRKINHVDLQA